MQDAYYFCVGGALGCISQSAAGRLTAALQPKFQEPFHASCKRYLGKHINNDNSASSSLATATPELREFLAGELSPRKHATHRRTCAAWVGRVELG